MRWCFSCSLTVKEKFKNVHCEDQIQLFTPPRKFRQKRCLKCKASRAVFWSLPSYKELKLTTKPLTGCTLGGLLIPMQNISFQSSGMRRKQNFYSLYFFILLSLQSSELLLLFLPLFFLLLGILVTGKVLGKTLKILGLDERKGRTWVVE